MACENTQRQRERYPGHVSPLQKKPTVNGDLRGSIDGIVQSTASAVATARTASRGATSAANPGTPSTRKLVVGINILAAVVLASIWMIGFIYRMSDAGHEPSWLITFIVGAVLFLPLVTRSWAPVAAWRSMWVAVVLCSMVLTFFLPEPPLYPPLFVVILLTTYSVVVGADRPVASGTMVVTSVLALALGIFGLVTADGEFSAWAALVLVATVIVAVLLGLFVRMRRDNQAELAAEKRRTEEARAEKAVLEERNRIARDLHDVVAHHITGIAVQAEAAPLRAGGDSAALTAEFSTIRQTALSALGEMRGVLGRLRDDQETPFAPAVRDLSGLPGLVRSLEESGHPVDLDIDLTGGEVPGRVASVIHSVVKESLSNVRRHAPGAPTTVRIRRSAGAGHAEDTVVVDIANGEPTRTSSMSGQEAGYGQQGMLERVNSVAGTLEVGHVPTGYRVHAELPVEVQ